MDSLGILTAAASGGVVPASAGGTAFFFVQIALIVVVFWFLIFRPQQKRQKEHEARINAVQKNDSVVTGGGLMGKVTKVADDHVEVEIAQGVRVKVVKSTLSNVQNSNTKAAND